MVANGPTILHADLDAFYASVEQLLDPSLRGRPIAVGGSPTGGVVLAASYEAKTFGVSGGMPGWRAARLCPELTFVRGHFERYSTIADQVMAVMTDVTPKIERISIDEAFFDISGATHLFGDAAQIGELVRRRVRQEIGLPISVGAASTKHLAKIASQVAKPDGLTVVPLGAERQFLDPLPVDLIWGVGPVTRKRLAALGIDTIGELAATPSDVLGRLLGHAAGRQIVAMARDDDARKVASPQRASSVSAQAALGRRAANPELVRAVLTHLADQVSRRLRQKDRAGRTVTVHVRFAGMRRVTRSHTLREATSTTLTLTEVAEALAWDAIGPAPTEISLLAISVAQLVDVADLQPELDLGELGDDAWRVGSSLGTARAAVDRSMDAIRSRFGATAVGYAPALLRHDAVVPDAVRALAEHEV